MIKTKFYYIYIYEIPKIESKVKNFGLIFVTFL